MYVYNTSGQEHHRKRSHSIGLTHARYMPMYSAHLYTHEHARTLDMSPRCCLHIKQDHQFHAHTHFIDAIIACHSRTANSHLPHAHFADAQYWFLQHGLNGSGKAVTQYALNGVYL